MCSSYFSSKLSPRRYRAELRPEAGPRLLNSNRRRKEANSEGEQHEAAECIDCDVYRIGHLKITQLVTVGSGCDFLIVAIRAESWFQAGFVGAGKWLRRSPAATRVALRDRLLMVSFKPMLLGVADATGRTNLATHRCSNFL